MDELEEFLSTQTVEVENPRFWWFGHRKDTPALPSMALDLLSIAAMSAEVGSEIIYA